VSRAYKKLAKRHHPDRHAQASSAEKDAAAERFKAVSEAYDVLSDPAKRNAYDTFGHATGSSSTADDAAQAMFEQMMFGAGAAPDVRRPRGVRGGALFYDLERRVFFQRRSTDVDGLHRETTDGISSTSCLAPVDGGSGYEASTSLPVGAWNVRLIEVDESVLTVTFGAAADAESKDDGVLRCVRTWTLPADADATSLDDNALCVEPGRVCVRVAKVLPPPVLRQEAAHVQSSGGGLRQEAAREAVHKAPATRHSADGEAGGAAAAGGGGEAAAGAHVAEVLMAPSMWPARGNTRSKKASRTRRGRGRASGLRSGFLNDPTDEAAAFPLNDEAAAFPLNDEAAAYPPGAFEEAACSTRRAASPVSVAEPMIGEPMQTEESAHEPPRKPMEAEHETAGQETAGRAALAVERLAAIDAAMRAQVDALTGAA
jgi:hypothetical protein